VIQNTSEELIGELLDDLLDKILQTLKSNSFKAQSQLLETLVSLIFHVEDMIKPHCDKLIDALIEQVRSEDPLTKKVAIDAIYSLTAIVKDDIVSRRMTILRILMPFRYHKVKPVREATLETIKLLKETGPQISENELASLEGKQVTVRKQSKSPMRGGAVVAPLTARSNNTS
jgi:hypothetical protein